MERYELKRKTYSLVNKQKIFTLHRVTKSFGALGIQEGVNNLTQGMADNSRTVTQTAAGIVGNAANAGVDMAKGAANTAKNLGAGAISTTGSVLNAVAKPVGTALQLASIPFGPLGWIASTAIKKGAQAVGKGLEKTGDNIAG